MTSTRTAALAAVLSSAASVVAAFTSPSVTSSATSKKSTTSIYSTVDPSVVTKKEYQDICGVDFDDSALSDRLKKTAYLYPKHVEVIEDFEPLVNKMVDDIVSGVGNKGWSGYYFNSGAIALLTPLFLFSLLHVIMHALTNYYHFFLLTSSLLTNLMN